MHERVVILIEELCLCHSQRERMEQKYEKFVSNYVYFFIYVYICFNEHKGQSFVLKSSSFILFMLKALTLKFQMCH